MKFCKGCRRAFIETDVPGGAKRASCNKATILAWINDEKWVNDFACIKVVEKLKAEVERLQKETDEKE